jgi:uncharacterized protein
MPVETSYPGVYIEELPSASHTVTPAPTSVAVFIGYANPFWEMPGKEKRKPPPYEEVVEAQSFADYEAAFGGFFHSPWLHDRLGQALLQFFENGGSMAYVVALKPEYYAKANGEKGGKVTAATATLWKTANEGNKKPGTVKLTALRPVGLAKSSTAAQEGLLMTVTVTNVVEKEDEVADVTITYGTTVEVYRRVTIAELIATLNQRSALVSAEANGEATKYEKGESSLTYGTAPESGGTTWVEPAQYGDVFKTNAPLDKIPVFNLMVLPGLTTAPTLAEALAYCEAKRAFLIMDAPEAAAADTATKTRLELSGPAIEEVWKGESGAEEPPRSANGALYFPYLRTTDPITDEPSSSPPSGLVAGVFAKEDTNRGVWKAPAGLETTILGTSGVVASGEMTDKQQGKLNEHGINCVRTFPGIGSVVFGARTLVAENPAQEAWKYVPVRRMALFLEQSLYTSLRWAIFEPNSTPLWNALRQEVEAFMLGLFRQGAFQGNSADEAFSVRCDETTTSQAEINDGIVNIRVGFAPLKPAEFVVVQIEQMAGQTQS